MNNPKNKLKPRLFKTDPETGRLTYKSAALIFSLFGLFAFTMTFVVECAKWVVSFVFNTVWLITEAFPIFGGVMKIFEHFAFNDVSGIFIIYCIALPLALPAVLFLPRIKIKKGKLSFLQFIIGFCICMGLMTVGSNVSNAFFSILSSFLPIVNTSNPVETAVTSAPWWFSFITVVIIAPIFEEIIFRKLLCDRLCAVGEGFAIMLSAVFFGVFHGNFSQVFYAFLIGAFLAFVYVKTGKLRYTIMYHMAVNFIGGILTPMLAGMINEEALMSPETTKALIALIPLVLFFMLEGAILTISAIGIAMIIAKRRELFLSIKNGPLLAPKNWPNALIFNAGIIAAIAMTVIRMTGSILG